jgi:hypothetical protein
MENLFVAVSMFILLFSAKQKAILLIIIAGSLMGPLIDYLIKDIAVFYTLNSITAILLAATSAYYVKNKVGRVYAILMISQTALCFSLVPDWGFKVNNILQYTLTAYNDSIYIVIISIGIAGSDNFLLRLYNCNSVAGSRSASRNRNSDKVSRDKRCRRGSDQ